MDAVIRRYEPAWLSGGQLMIDTKPTTNSHAPHTSKIPVNVTPPAARAVTGPGEIPASPKRLARIAGVLYLLVGIFGGFAQGFGYPKIYVAGDAATAAASLIANSGLVRLGVVADFFDNTIWVFLALVLYRLLKHVNKSVARAMVVLVAIGAGITMLNAVFEFEALRGANGAVNLCGFGVTGFDAQ